MLFTSLEKVLESLNGVLEVNVDGVTVQNKKRLQEESIDLIVRNAVFNEDPDIQKGCRWIVWETARNLSINPSSIQALYEARGRG